MGDDDKVGAVWWRVSTDDQRETSPDMQVKEAMELAKLEGCQVPEEYILGTDWESLSVWNSPPMETLKELIRSGSIQAVFMYDGDRGPSRPVHRLFFKALCDEHGVKVRCKYGQVPEGDMGEVIEFLSAWAKEKQVLRAQQGARDGLRDRAKIRGLPAVPIPPYGYTWNGSVFEPDPRSFSVAQRIWSLALECNSIRSIARSLAADAISSPRGKPYWATSTIAGILSNPAYAGDYVALRTRSIEPNNRKGNTYGKTSKIVRDTAEQVAIPNVISQAIVTRQEYERVERRLAANKAQGGRVNQRYLLRGRLKCEVCSRQLRGKVIRSKGKPYYRYLCPAIESQVKGNRCSSRSVNGPPLETSIWEKTVEFLLEPELFIRAAEEHHEGHGPSVEVLEASTKRLEDKLVKLDAADARAYSGYARALTSEETYQSVAAELRAERGWVEEELTQQATSLYEAKQHLVSAEEVRKLYPLLAQRLEQASFDDQLFVFECLDALASVGPSGVTLSLAVPHDGLSSVSTRPGRAGWVKPLLGLGSDSPLPENSDIKIEAV